MASDTVGTATRDLDWAALPAQSFRFDGLDKTSLLDAVYSVCHAAALQPTREVLCKTVDQQPWTKDLITIPAGTYTLKDLMQRLLKVHPRLRWYRTGDVITVQLRYDTDLESPLDRKTSCEFKAGKSDWGKVWADLQDDWQGVHSHFSVNVRVPRVPFTAKPGITSRELFNRFAAASETAWTAFVSETPSENDFRVDEDGKPYKVWTQLSVVQGETTSRREEEKQGAEKEAVSPRR